MKCVSYTRTMPWKNHTGELTITDQNQRIAEYLAEHKEFDLQKKYSDRKGAENASAAFDKMIDDGVGRKFDCIIVASMYYCGPGFPAARQAIKETLYEAGVDLIVLEEGLDTRTASRKEVEDYFEEKRCEMHAEIMFAWRKKQGAGFRLTNSVPYGYIRRNGESNMVKDEEVASLNVQLAPNLNGNVPAVGIVQQILKGHHDAIRITALSICVIIVIIDGDEPNPHHWENLFQILSHLNVVTTKSRQVLDYDAVDFAGFDVLHHLRKAWSLKIGSRVTIICIFSYQIQFWSFCNEIPNQFSLISDAVAFSLISVLDRQPQIGCCSYVLILFLIKKQSH